MEAALGTLQIIDSDGNVVDFAATVRAVADGELDPSGLELGLVADSDETSP